MNFSVSSANVNDDTYWFTRYEDNVNGKKVLLSKKLKTTQVTISFMRLQHVKLVQNFQEKRYNLIFCTIGGTTTTCSCISLAIW